MIPIPSWLAPYMGLVKVAALLAIFGAGMWFEAQIKDTQIANDKADRMEQIAASATDALAQFQHDAKLINGAAASFTALQSDNDVKFARIETELRNVFKSHPLPADCRPDDGRVRSLSAAISATNDTAAGRRTGPAVPANN